MSAKRLPPPTDAQLDKWMRMVEWIQHAAYFYDAGIGRSIVARGWAVYRDDGRHCDITESGRAALADYKYAQELEWYRSRLIIDARHASGWKTSDVTP